MVLIIQIVRQSDIMKTRIAALLVFVYDNLIA